MQLDLVTWEDFRIVIDFHGIGRRFRGVMAAAAYSYRRAVPSGEKSRLERPRSVTESSRNPISPIRPAMTRRFQYNAAENPESVERRFHEWLEDDVLPTALGDWRASIA